MSSKNEIENTYERMHSVDLHRANSIENASVVFSQQTETPVPKTDNVFSYVSSRSSSIAFEIKQLKIELIMFMYMFASVMRRVSTTTMIMDKVCLAHLGRSPYDCTHPEEYPDLNIEIEKMSNNYNIVHSLITMVPSSVIACFIGAWSDKYSRKIPLLVALVGIIMDGLLSSICAALPYSRVEFFCAAAIFSGFSGGLISVLTILYSYAADTTTNKKRTFKFALMEAAFGLSMPLGQLAGGWLFQWIGYVPVFLVSTGCHVFTLVWVLFVLEETKGLDNKDSWKVKFKNLWSFQPVIDSFKATIKPRPNKGKVQILLLMLAMSVVVLCYASVGSVMFLYCHHMYKWGNTKFSTISSLFQVAGTILTVISVPIFRKLNVADPILGIVGSISLLIKNIIMGVSTKVGVYFLACSLGLFGGLGTLAGRSRISQVTAKEDIGKVFAFLSTAESILPIIGSVAVSQIFNLTLNFYPGLIFIIMGCLLLAPAVVYAWLVRLPSVDYDQLHNSTKESITNRNPFQNQGTVIHNPHINSANCHPFQLQGTVIHDPPVNEEDLRMRELRELEEILKEIREIDICVECVKCSELSSSD